MRFSSVNFADLAAPDIIEPLDFETIYAARRARFLELWAEARAANPALPDFDTLLLETDPVAVVLQESAYRELVLRQRVNDAARAVMLPYAIGTDLDAIASLFAVARLPGEPDDRFRRRVQVAPEAMSCAGTVGAYIFHALTAAPTLADVTVQQTAPGRVAVTCMGSGRTRVPTDDEITAVRARLAEPDIRPLTDVVTVRGPAVHAVNIAASLVMPRSPGQAAALAKAQADLTGWFASSARLGVSLYRSAIIARLCVAGVLNVELASPAEDIVIGEDSCVMARSISVSLRTVE